MNFPHAAPGGNAGRVGRPLSALNHSRRRGDSPRFAGTRQGCAPRRHRRGGCTQRQRAFEIRGRAEASGVIGETIAIRNPDSNKKFQAKIEAKGKVSVDAR